MSAGLIIGIAGSALLLGFAFKALMPAGGAPQKDGKDNWIGDGSGADSSGYFDSPTEGCGSDGGGDCGGGD